MQYRGFAFFSAEGCKNIDLPLEYAWMQEIEVGKLSGDAPLDFLVNLFLWIDQVVIILDDFASKYEQPRELIIGDEMKFEKVQVRFRFYSGEPFKIVPKHDLERILKPKS